VNVVILGGGVIGVATAWYLSEAGYQVTVVDRQPATGMETSFANGGQIAAGAAEPWANPAAPFKILKWLGQPDAPILWRLRADPQQWWWTVRFLYECLPRRARNNTLRMLSLAVYSRSLLVELRSRTGIRYHGLQTGIVYFYTERAEFQRARAIVDALPELAAERRIVSADEIIEIEPAMASFRSHLAGGVYSPRDESGDAHVFTQELARLCAERGVGFELGWTVEGLVTVGNRVTGVHITDREGRRQALSADRYVVCLGSYSPLLLRDIGVRTGIYPVKGYSATIAVGGSKAAPTVSLTDAGHKMVFTRLGPKLRIAGTAEFAGYNTDLDRVRCEALVARARVLWPGLGKPQAVTYWAGLRPATPGNVPLVGVTRYPNLYLNTGHGTLGWTMCCGSGRLLADIMSGAPPALDVWRAARRADV